MTTLLSVHVLVVGTRTGAVHEAARTPSGMWMLACRSDRYPDRRLLVTEGPVSCKKRKAAREAP